MPTTVSLETTDPRSHQRASHGARTGDVSRSDSSVAVTSSTGSQQGAAPSRGLLRIVVPVVATLSYVASLAALLVWPPLTLVVFLVTSPFDRNRVFTSYFYRLLPAFWSRSFPFWRIRIEGSWPADGGSYVIVANHQSFLDIFALCNIAHEWKWVAKKSLFRIPMFGWGLSLTGSISLDRGDTASALAVMAECHRYLAERISVMMFPEGTRSTDGKLLPFKPGAFRLALEAGVPVLPIAVTGTAAGMPKGGFWVRPTTITLRILEPVPTAGLKIYEIPKVRDEVRARIARALELEEQPAPTNPSC